ncbi:Uncharacterised protein [uncultured archaeon]|nr:Uncharacterised protein [uncultured archaeon]
MQLEQLAIVKTTHQGEITAYVLKSEKIHPQTLELIRKNKNAPGLIVCITRPAEELLKELKIKTNVLLIDVYGKTESPQVISIPDPAALTELSIAITQALQALPEKRKYLIIEGLGGLTIYNNPIIVQRFVQFIFSKMRTWNICAYILTDSTTEISTLSLIKQNADKVKE